MSFSLDQELQQTEQGSREIFSMETPTFPDNAMGVFTCIEDRWESGSQGLMRLMEFSVELLKRAVLHGQIGDLGSSAKYINRSSDFVITGSKLMITFGDINSSDYDKFRETRDIRGNPTDRRLVELHVKQKQLTEDLLAILSKVLEDGDIDSEDEKEIADHVTENTHALNFTKALIGANDAHKAVFGAHKSVCSRAVKKGKPSIRGNHIEDFRNVDFSPLLPKLKHLLKDRI
ncbi:hypothetical protein [Saccharospirillum salsuginis]|uniref:Uncharacterized protein n=1 Tax=Saccharospirillum salsuginis TaxID=418750 RepID=A0A918KBW6_9GAMM|nr:hypothetical protein [Saccharospirillum salsuginis]GGX57329.1 hypothetical protein GCM10007392_26110 [Saccharospirillum salsuginis]